MLKSGQTYFKSLAVYTAKFLKYVWPFFNIVYERVNPLSYSSFIQDHISRRQHATRIRFLPKGTVTFETISTNRHIGVIEQEAPERNMKSPSKINK